VTLLATVAGVVVALTLLGSAAAHAARPGALVAALADQGVLPARATAAVVVAAEVVLGIAVVVDATRTAGLVGAVVLFAGYAAYTGYLRRTRTSAVPCGCGDGVAVNGWVVARAGALATAALLGLVARPMGVGGSVEAVVALCAGVTFACLLWRLPAAMTVGGYPA
jgi:hypothetical protein